MKRNINATIRNFNIVSAIIWAATMIGCALILKENFVDISILLCSAAAIHVLFAGTMLNKWKKEESEVQS